MVNRQTKHDDYNDTGRYDDYIFNIAMYAMSGGHSTTKSRKQ